MLLYSDKKWFMVQETHSCWVSESITLNSELLSILNILILSTCSPGGCDWDVQYGVISVGLHEALDVEDVAGEVEAAARPASFERGVVPVIHLIEPVGRVWELALKWEYLQQHISTCQSHLYKLCANGDSRNFGINGWMIRAIKCGGENRFLCSILNLYTLHPPMRFNFDRQWWTILGKEGTHFKFMNIFIFILIINKAAAVAFMWLCLQLEYCSWWRIRPNYEVCTAVLLCLMFIMC